MSNSKFLGRDDSLEDLRFLLEKRSSSLVVIRGRRRIGKSRLVEEFAKDLPFYSFSGLPPTNETTKQSQRNEFGRQIQQQLGIPGVRMDDWGDLFTLVAKQTEKGRVVILFDEISWMGSKDPLFLGKLKIVWDLYFSKNPKLILILCGSVSSWIEKNIISSTGFFGRITQKIVLDELKLPACGKLLDAVGFRGSDIEKLMILAVTGGVPWYLSLVQPNLSATENIKYFCFSPKGRLIDEFQQIFHDLFDKKSEVTQNIVKLLVDHPLTNKEISDQLGYPSGGPLSDYLSDLVVSGYVAKDYTWSIKTGNESRTFRYRLSDNFLRFYLKYVAPKYNQIKSDSYRITSITNLVGWDAIIGFQFENLVLKNRRLIIEALRIQPDEILCDNPYYQKGTKDRKGCQIDYMIQTEHNMLYLCEVKFSKNPIQTSVAKEMEEKIRRLAIPKGFAVRPVLIHVNGMTSDLELSDVFAHKIDFAKLMNS